MEEQASMEGVEGADIVLTDDERQPCEIWSRVMGYHRPISQWNIGKRAEFYERRPFVFRQGKE